MVEDVPLAMNDELQMKKDPARVIRIERFYDTFAGPRAYCEVIAGRGPRSPKWQRILVSTLRRDWRRAADGAS